MVRTALLTGYIPEVNLWWWRHLNVILSLHGCQGGKEPRLMDQLRNALQARWGKQDIAESAIFFMTQQTLAKNLTNEMFVTIVLLWRSFDKYKTFGQVAWISAVCQQQEHLISGEKEAVCAAGSGCFLWGYRRNAQDNSENLVSWSDTTF